MKGHFKFSFFKLFFVLLYCASKLYRYILALTGDSSCLTKGIWWPLKLIIKMALLH